MIKYLAGPVAVDSSWLDEVGFAENRDKSKGIKSFLGIGLPKGIAITFKDGTRCFYQGTTESQYRSLLRSSSKGKWVHKNIFTRSYETF